MIEVAGCELPGCANPATLVLAFSCGHGLCKTHEYFWSQPAPGIWSFGADRAGSLGPPDSAAVGCPACNAGVPRRQSEADAARRCAELLGGPA